MHPRRSQSQLLCVAAFTILVSFVTRLCGHPQCTDFRPPFEPAQPPSHCVRYVESSCCTARQDSDLGEAFSAFLHGWNKTAPATNGEGSGGVVTSISDECQRELKALQCLTCSNFAAHAFDVESTGEEIGDGSGRVPGLCPATCRNLVGECGLDVLETFFKLQPSHEGNESSSTVASASTEFCTTWSLNDDIYCYPNILHTEVGELPPGVGVTSRDGDSPSEPADADNKCLCVEEVATGLVNPLSLATTYDGTGRLFIGEQQGIIKILTAEGTVLAEPYLDMHTVVGTHNGFGDERGLLGLAVHPHFKTNRKFYTYYSHYTVSGKHLSRVSEWKQSRDNPDRADDMSERIILSFQQPQNNHNGGQITFGPDGYLYVFSGDGGGAGDKHGDIGNAQNMSTLLGKILRIDVNTRHPRALYSVPGDNPFIGRSNTRPEIYAYGLRNPWRCSFDRGDNLTGHGAGRLFCGDVGQRKREEIDIITKGGDYGWRGLEGTLCYDQKLCKQLRNTSILPIHEYNRRVGRSVTGGYVYRGCQWPNLQGRYIYGDYYNGRIFALTEDPTQPTGWRNEELCLGSSTTCTNRMSGNLPKAILSFGEDEFGEIYVLAVPRHRNQPHGGIYRIVDPRRRSDPSTCEARSPESATPPPPQPPTTPPGPSAVEEGKCQRCFRRQTTEWTLEEICASNHSLYLKAQVLYVDIGFQSEGFLLMKISDWYTNRPPGAAGDQRPSYSFMWIVKDAITCGCMQFTVGETYFLMATVQDNNLLLDMNSIRLQWRDDTPTVIETLLSIKKSLC